MSGVLAEAVSREIRRRQPTGRKEPVRRNADGENRGLRVFRERQAVFRTVEDDAAERLAERVVRFGKSVAADRKRIGQGLPHAWLLRSLSRKNCGNHAAAIS